MKALSGRRSSDFLRTLLLRSSRGALNQRKTVTFGDGSAVAGKILISAASVLVLLAIWWAVTYKWGLPSGFAEQAERADRIENPEGRFSETKLVRACKTDPQCSYSQMFNHRTLPSPVNVLRAVNELATDGWRQNTLQAHTWASLERVLIGLLLGVLVGVPIGLAMGLSSFFKSVFDPIVEGFRPIPPLAFVPLLIIWFGIGETSKITLLFFAALWIMIIGARSGVLSVKLSKVHAAYSLGASKPQVLTRVILPNALPEILTAVRVSLGVCWGTLVAAEIVAATEGLGFMIWDAQKKLRMDVVVVGIIVIGLMGVLLDMVMRKLENWLIPWRGKG